MGFKARRSSSAPAPVVDTPQPEALAMAQDLPSPIPVLPLQETIRRAIQVAVTVYPSLRQAARQLQMPPSSLRDKLDQFGIDMPGARPARQHPCQPAFTMRESADEPE